MSVNLEIQVGLWTPKSVPNTAISASLRSRKRGLAAGPELLLGDDHAHRLSRPPAAAGRGRRSHRGGCPGRFLGHLDLGDQVALGRVPAWELDPGGFADHAAPAVAPDEILRPQRSAVGQLDVDAGVVLREAGHLAPVVDPTGSSAIQPAMIRSIWFCQIPSEYGMARREVAHVQHRRARTSRPGPPCPRRGTGRRPRAGRAPRSCARESRRPVSRRARDPARRSTIATSTFANASSAASIIPVGPPPAITTACSSSYAPCFEPRICALRRCGLRRAIMRHQSRPHEGLDPV